MNGDGLRILDHLPQIIERAPKRSRPPKKNY